MVQAGYCFSNYSRVEIIFIIGRGALCLSWQKGFRCESNSLCIIHDKFMFIDCFVMEGELKVLEVNNQSRCLTGPLPSGITFSCFGKFLSI